MMIIYQVVSQCYTLCYSFCLKILVSSFHWIKFSLFKVQLSLYLLQKPFPSIPQTELCSTFLPLHNSLQKKAPHYIEMIHKSVSPARLFMIKDYVSLPFYPQCLAQYLAHSCSGFKGFEADQGKRYNYKRQ